MRTIIALVLLTASVQAADFKIAVDDDLVETMTWMRERDNATPGRARDSTIASDGDWLQIEVGAMLKAQRQQMIDAEAQIAADEVRKRYAPKK